MQTQRHLKIFISSTFQDMDKEREILLKETFLELKKIAKERSVEVTEIDLRTGVTKEQAENGEVVKICLDEIERCTNSPIFFLGMLGNRYGSVNWIGDVSSTLLEDSKYSWITNFSDRSLTEIEIISALERNKKHNRAFIYLKEGRDDNPKLSELKNRLIEKSKNNKNIEVSYYKDNSEFRKKTIESFTKALDKLYPKDEKPSEVEKLRATHQIFAQSRQKVYIPHLENEKILSDFMESDEDRLLLYGESGYGKSALIANYFEKLKNEESHFVITHYIGGAGEFSNDLHQMLRRVMLEIKEEFNLSDKLPTEPQKIMDEFALWLHRVERPTVIVFDGYNQIENDLKEKLFYYIPEKLEKVKLIITSIKDNYPINNKYKIEPLTRDEQKKLVVDYLKEYGKEGMALKIQNRITEHPQTDNTLFLKTLLNEIRLLGNFDNVEKEIDNYLQANDVVALFIKIFERLESDYRENLAKEVLSLLYVSRDGLSEDNLMEIINQNSTKKLTRLEFSPLFLAVEEHFIDRGGLYGFFHDYIREAVENRYLSRDELVNVERRRITDYFEGREIDNQRVRELPFQLFELKDRYKLYKNLIDVYYFAILYNSNEYELLKYVKFIDENNQFDISNRLKKELLDKSFLNSNFEIDTILDNIAIFMNELYPKFDISLQLHKQALEITQKKFGDNHPKTAKSYNNLGAINQSIGKYDEAIIFYNKALDIHKKHLGEEHLDTITNYNNISSCYYLEGNYNEAFRLSNKILSIKRKKLGENNLDTALSYNNIGEIYKEKHKYEEALNCFNKAIEIYNKNEIKQHKNIANVYSNLGLLYDLLKDFNNAYEYHKKALILREKHFGENHSDTITSINNLALHYTFIKKIEDALPLYKKALNLSKKLVGDNHSDTAISYINLGKCYKLNKEYEDALPYYKNAINILEVRKNRILLSKAYNELALYYEERGMFNESLTYFEKCLKEVKFGTNKNHPDIAKFNYNLAGLYYDSLGEYEKALPYFKKVFEIDKNFLKKNGENIIINYTNVTNYLYKTKRFSEANFYLIKIKECTKYAN